MSGADVKEIARKAAERVCSMATSTRIYGISQRSKPVVEAINAALAAQRALDYECRAQLEHIANADIKTWGEGWDNPAEFMRWAQSIARHILAKEAK